VAAHHPRETGPAALAFAAVVAQHSLLVRAFDKRIIARLFGGMTNFGFTPNTKISVTADSVVCRTSNVDIAARTCDLTFGVRKRTLTGRETNEFSATALSAVASSEGAAGSIVENISKLECMIDPNEIKKKDVGSKRTIRRVVHGHGLCVAKPEQIGLPSNPENG